jgi:hypothetical protein
VAFDRKTEAAEFAEHARAPRFDRRHPRPRIHVDVVQSAAAFVGPTRSGCRPSASDRGRDDACDAVGVVLTPALVEGHPHHDRRMVGALAHDLGQLALELLLRLGARVVRARHVLPHEHAEAIALGVEELGLDLDVLAQHVAAHLLHRLDVEAHRFERRRGVEAVGPEALVERTELKQRLAVQASRNCRRVGFAHVHLAQADVARHLVLPT